MQGTAPSVSGAILFTNNSAIHHGVMTIVNSAFDIISSTFTNNGGVMATFADSLLDIIGSTFTNNAGVLGGVMDTFSSIFSITDSIFSDNRAKQNLMCGVRTIAAENCSFNISSSTFTNNSAICCDVMFTSNSLFNITNSAFTNNRLSVNVVDGDNIKTKSSHSCGGILTILNSLLSITSSAFINNIATTAIGGVAFMYDSSLNVASSIFVNNVAYVGGVIAMSKSSSLIAYYHQTESFCKQCCS